MDSQAIVVNEYIALSRIRQKNNVNKAFVNMLGQDFVNEIHQNFDRGSSRYSPCYIRLFKKNMIKRIRTAFENLSDMYGTCRPDHIRFSNYINALVHEGLTERQACFVSDNYKVFSDIVDGTPSSEDISRLRAKLRTGIHGNDVLHAICGDIVALNKMREKEGLDPISVVRIGNYTYLKFSVKLNNYPENLERYEKEVEQFFPAMSAAPVDLGEIDLLISSNMSVYARPKDGNFSNSPFASKRHIHPNVMRFDSQSSRSISPVCLGNYSTLRHILVDSGSFMPVYDTIMAVINNYGMPPHIKLSTLVYGQTCSHCSYLGMGDEFHVALMEDREDAPTMTLCDNCCWRSGASHLYYSMQVRNVEHGGTLMTLRERDERSIFCSYCGNYVTQSYAERAGAWFDRNNNEVPPGTGGSYFHCDRCTCICHHGDTPHKFPRSIGSMVDDGKRYCVRHTCRTINGNRLPIQNCALVVEQGTEHYIPKYIFEMFTKHDITFGSDTYVMVRKQPPQEQDQNAQASGETQENCEAEMSEICI